MIILCVGSFQHGHGWCAYLGFKSSLCNLLMFKSIMSPHWFHLGPKHEVANLFTKHRFFLPCKSSICSPSTYNFPLEHWSFGWFGIFRSWRTLGFYHYSSNCAMARSLETWHLEWWVILTLIDIDCAIFCNVSMLMENIIQSKHMSRLEWL